MPNTIKKSQLEALNIAQKSLWDSASLNQVNAKIAAHADLRKAHQTRAKLEFKAYNTVADIIDLITTDIFQVVED